MTGIEGRVVGVTAGQFLGPGLTWLDADADADQDLVVASDTELLLYTNPGGFFSAPSTIDTVGFGAFLFASVEGVPLVCPAGRFVAIMRPP